jgi:hypothetical protein
MYLPITGFNNVAINTLKGLPNKSTKSSTGLNNPKTTLPYTKTSKLENVGVMRLSVINSNTGGQRGILPCKGTPYTHIVLRKPALSNVGGIYPPQGYARGQFKGLATQKDKPMNLPILKTHDFYNSAMNAKFK